MNARSCSPPLGRLQLGNSRGFTLAELMIVVLIMGILAALGIASFRQKMSEARRTEALAGLQAIGAAQEAHRAEFGVYLDVSPDLSTYYPPVRSQTVQNFWGHPGSTMWERLDPDLPGAVMFSYATTAGLPFQTLDLPDSNVVGISWPAADTVRDPWYIVAACGDSDGDGEFAYFVSTNLISRVHVQNGAE